MTTNAHALLRWPVMMRPSALALHETAQMTEKSSLLREQLRRHTACLHRRLEALLDLTTPSLSLERYRWVLEVMHGFHAPIEERMAQLPGSMAPPFALPARAPLIVQDLLALGVEAEHALGWPRCGRLPALTTPAQLAGCLYVLEGSRLGGRIIARFLRRRFELGTTNGAAFFTGGDLDVAERWRAVLAWLAHLERKGTPTALVVAGALDTFATFVQWVEARGAFDERVR